MTFNDSTSNAYLTQTEQLKQDYQNLIMAGDYDAAALVIADGWLRLDSIARSTLADLLFRFVGIGDEPTFASGIDWDFGEGENDV